MGDITAAHCAHLCDCHPHRLSVHILLQLSPTASVTIYIFYRRFVTRLWMPTLSYSPSSHLWLRLSPHTIPLYASHRNSLWLLLRQSSQGFISPGPECLTFRLSGTWPRKFYLLDFIVPFLRTAGDCVEDFASTCYCLHFYETTCTNKSIILAYLTFPRQSSYSPSYHLWPLLSHFLLSLSTYPTATLFDCFRFPSPPINIFKINGLNLNIWLNDSVSERW